MASTHYMITSLRWPAITALTLLAALTGSVALADDNGSSASDTTAAVASASEIHLTGCMLRSAPVTSANETLSLSTEVVTLNPNVGRTVPGRRTAGLNGPEVHIRGGDLHDNSFYLNGVRINDPYAGYTTMTLGRHALSSFRVLPTEYYLTLHSPGENIVQMATVRGGERISGMFEAMSDNTIGSDFDQNWYTAQLSGPVPHLKSTKFSATLQRHYLGDRDPSPVTEDVLKMAGVDTAYANAKRLPANSAQGWSYHGRLDIEPGDNMALAVTLDRTTDTWQDYQQAWLLNPAHAPRFEDKNLVFGVQWQHRLSRTLDYHVQLSYFKCQRQEGDGALFDNYLGLTRPHSNPEYEDFSLFWTPAEERTWQVPDPASPGNSIDVTADVPSYYPRYFKSSSTCRGISGRIAQKVGELATLDFAVDYRHYTIRQFLNLDATKQENASLLVNRYGYDSLGQESDDEGFGREAKHPQELTAAVGLELERDWCRVGGALALQCFDDDAWVVVNPLRPLGSDDAPYGRIDEADTRKADRSVEWSPRLSVELRPFDRTRIRGDFAVSYEAVPYDYHHVDLIYAGNRVDAGSYYPLSLLPLEPGEINFRSVSLSHRFGSAISVAASCFRRRSSGTPSICTVRYVRPMDYSAYVNGINTRCLGGKLDLLLSLANRYSLAISYALDDTKHEGVGVDRTSYQTGWVDPNAGYFEDLPPTWDKNHSLTARLDLDFGPQDGPLVAGFRPLASTHVSLLVRTAAGARYTPVEVYDGAIERALQQQPKGSINSARMPSITTVNIAIERSISLGQFELTPFLIVKNLLDAENIDAFWAATSSAEETGYLDTPIGQAASEQYPTYNRLYRVKQFDAQNYAPPRQVYLGLRMSF